MNGHVLSTARLVRPAYRTPATGEIPSYLDTLEDQRDLARDESRQLQARLSEVQAKLAQALAELDTVQVKPAASAKLPGAKPTRAKTGRKWIAGHVRLGGQVPIDLAERTGIAAIIQRPLKLRSGAVLDPVHKAAVRGGISITFPDSSWLVLSVLAERAGVHVTQRELIERVFPGQTGSGVRTAILRARMTLELVDGEQDLETSWNHRDGWRLLVAEKQ